MHFRTLPQIPGVARLAPAACAVDESLGLAFRFIYADGQVVCLREVVTVHEVFVRVRGGCGDFVRRFIL